MQKANFMTDTGPKSSKKEVLNRREFLKLILAGTTLLPLASCHDDELIPIMPKPNIIVILADDIGPGDIGFYHTQRTGQPPVIPTPNIDQMISEGMRFNDAHAPASLCAPTRFSMLTGNYSFRGKSPFGAWNAWNDSGIKPNMPTSARIAKKAGYATAFFGKWGCGGQLKEKNSTKYVSGKNQDSIARADFSQLYEAANYCGFDYALELPSGIQGYPFAFYENSKWWPLKKNSKLTWVGSEQSQSSSKNGAGIGDSNWDPSQVGPILASNAVKYIQKQTNENPDQPFFMYYCSQAVHIPHTPPEELDGIPVAGSTPSDSGDLVLELDIQVGLLVEALKKAGVYENTLLIFTSDNGGLGSKITGLADFGHDASHGLRGSKGGIYEGGDRVPFIAVWPNRIKSATESLEPIVAHDIVATIAAINGQQLPKSAVKDSLNLLPIFRGDSIITGHEVILQQNAKVPLYAIRKNQWKLILRASSRSKDSVKYTVPIALFDLINNPLEDEDYNLINSDEHQSLIRDLHMEYVEIRQFDKATV